MAHLAIFSTLPGKKILHLPVCEGMSCAQYSSDKSTDVKFRIQVSSLANQLKITDLLSVKSSLCCHRFGYTLC